MKPTKYSDLIKLQDYLPIYDILAELPNAWMTFIPTRQFCDLLNRSLTAMTSLEPAKRKSMWVRGTFGTGKSHASAVVKHLLCDDLESINGYISNIEDAQLRERLRNFRKRKRFFPITLKGVENAYDIPHFSLAIQRETQKVLAAVAPNMRVNSDFTTAIEWIDRHRETFESAVLNQDEDLLGMVDSVDMTIDKLKRFDSTIYSMVEDAITRHLGPLLQHSNISEWLVEVQQKLQQENIADGLVIFWDEFTSVMDTLKSDRINVLQNIAEKSQQHNIFLFLISHRTELQSFDNRSKDISKMSDRFEDVEYSMDSISTYLIMRHSLMVNEGSRMIYDALNDLAYNKLDSVVQFLTESNKEEKQHIQKLFPLHPFTAYLCSTLSNHIGSSNRTVVKFMHDEELGLGGFLENEEAFSSRKLLTPDILWDFFLTEFDRDPACTSFTSVYHSYKDKIGVHGNDYLRVFKAVLLLNALAPKFGRGNATTEKLSPTIKVIRHMFEGDSLENKLRDILDYLHDNNIINRNIFDEYKIAASNYNQTVLNEEKRKVQTSYRLSTDLFTYDAASKDEFANLFKVDNRSVKREAVFTMYPCEATEAQLRSYLNKFTSDKSNLMHVVVFTALQEDDRDGKALIIKDLSKDFEDCVMVLIDETFTRDYYIKFVDALATHNIATQQHQKAEAEEYSKHAHQFISKWVQRALNGNFTIYLNGDTIGNNGVLSQIGSLISNRIAPRIFHLGFEKVKKYQEVPATFFDNKNHQAVLEQVLQAASRDGIMQHGGSAIHIQEIFRENGNILLTADGRLSEFALTSGAWVVDVCKKVDECIESAKKKYHDRFSLGDVLAPLSAAPYGLFASFANSAVLAYALRKHRGDLFLPTISQPISDEKLAEYLKEILDKWRRGSSDQNSGKWLLRFGSPEESQLTKLLVDVFDLSKVSGKEDIKSLDQARWYYQKFCNEVSKYPIWVLKYVSMPEDQKKAIEGIMAVFDPTQSPSIDRIKEVFKQVSLNRIDLNILLTNPKKYEQGFVRFVETIDEAPIKKEWWAEMLDAVETLQSEVAYRRESDVRQRIVKFYINKTSKPEIPQALLQTPQQKQKQSSSIDNVKNAREKVKSANMPNMFWQKLVLELLEKYPEVSDFWNDCL